MRNRFKAKQEPHLGVSAALCITTLCAISPLQASEQGNFSFADLMKPPGPILGAQMHCEASSFKINWPDSFDACIGPNIAQRIGDLCLTLSWMCSKQPVAQWLPMFLKNNRSVSDVIDGGDSVVVIGSRDRSDWQLRVQIEEIENGKHAAVAELSVLELAPGAQRAPHRSRQRPVSPSTYSESAQQFLKSAKEHRGLSAKTQPER